MDTGLRIGRVGIISHTWSAINCTDMKNMNRVDLDHYRHLETRMTNRTTNGYALNNVFINLIIHIIIIIIVIIMTTANDLMA